jgi:hypothetical protein
METWYILVSLFDSFWIYYRIKPEKKHYDKYEQESGSVVHLHAK